MYQHSGQNSHITAQRILDAMRSQPVQPLPHRAGPGPLLSSNLLFILNKQPHQVMDFNKQLGTLFHTENGRYINLS